MRNLLSAHLVTFSSRAAPEWSCSNRGVALGPVGEPSILEFRIVADTEGLVHAVLSGRMDLAGIHQIEPQFSLQLGARHEPVAIDLSIPIVEDLEEARQRLRVV